MTRPLGALGVILLLASPVAAQRRPMTVDDFLALAAVSSPRIAPDGQTIAFTVTIASLDSNRNLSHIWTIPATGGVAHEITTGGGETAPAWSPDGRTITYLASGGGAPQIWRIAATGGTPVQLTTIPSGVDAYRWSPDGRTIFFSADTKWPTIQPLDRLSGPWPTTARLWDELFFRFRGTWRTGLRRHLYRLDLAGGRVTDLTPIDRDVPALPLAGSGFAVSPVGTELAVSYSPDSAATPFPTTHVFLMGPDGTGRQPAARGPGDETSPSYSPDGRYLAWLATAAPGTGSDRRRIVLYERATGRSAPITEDWDRDVRRITWMPDSRSLIAEVEERGERVFYGVEVPSGRTTRLAGDGVNRNVEAAPQGDFLVFVHESAAEPPEIYRSDPSGAGARPLTRFNAEAVARLALAPAERFSFAGAGGDSVSGWIVKPPDFSPSRKYPLIYLIHGGPYAAWDDGWSPDWNYALFAARGVVVAGVNFHGSNGYGTAFAASATRNWGGPPCDDLMRGLDYLAGLPWVDSTRMAAAGGSWGGYMVYWLAGHTGRFRALVAEDGIFNPVSYAGTTDDPWSPAGEFGGSQATPQGRALMEKWSPANYLSRWTTPLLVIQGGQDTESDPSEGLQAFTAARLRGVPARFLYFPTEGPAVLRPRERRLRWATIFDWLAARLGAGPAINPT